MSKVMKKTFLALILSLVLVATSALIMPKASAEVVQNPGDFAMVKGCALRIGTDDTENGMRFSAQANKEWFESLNTEDAEIITGTFIMPFDYIEKYGAINEKNCFTDNVYTWQGKENTTGKKILHVACTSYLTNSLLDENVQVYRLNGSVVNMLPQNLDREYVGIAYIGVINGGTTKYYFADSDVNVNHRSIVTIAQNILLDETAEVNDSDIATGYLNQYINYYKETTGAAPTKSFVNECYVGTKNGYEKVESMSGVQEVTLNTPQDFISTVTLNTQKEGYIYIPSLSTPSVNITEDKVVKNYYDIDDGEYIFDSAKGNVDTVLANNNIKDISVTSGGILQLSNNWGYHSNLSLHFGLFGSGWNKIYFNEPFSFKEETDTLSVMVKNLSVDQDYEVEVEIPCNNSIYNANTSAKGKLLLKKDQQDAYKTVIKLDRKIHYIKAFDIIADYYYRNINQGNKYYGNAQFLIDCIRPEYNFEIITGNKGVLANPKNIELFKADIDNQTKSIDVLNSLDILGYTREEVSNATTATIKTLPNGEAQAVTLVDGKFDLNVVEETNYQVDFTTNIGGKVVTDKFYILGYYENYFTGFEEEVLDVDDAQRLAKVRHCLDGNYAAMVGWTSLDWARYHHPNKPFALKSECTTLCLWIYSSEEYTTTTNHWLYVSEFYMKNECIDGDTHFYKGWNYYELPFRADPKPAGYVIKDLEFLMTEHQNLIVDRVAFK